MRDDLYKTVPPTSGWRRVLKLACNRVDWAEARAAMEHTIQKDILGRLDSKWLATLRAEINQPCPDMFEEDSRPAKIQAHRISATAQTERQLCDIAQGLWYRNRPAILFNEALRELCRQSTEAGIEHLGALIRQQRSAREAADAMKELRTIAVEMTFDVPATQNKRVRKDDRSFLEQTVE